MKSNFATIIHCYHTYRRVTECDGDGDDDEDTGFVQTETNLHFIVVSWLHCCRFSGSFSLCLARSTRLFCCFLFGKLIQHIIIKIRKKWKRCNKIYNFNFLSTAHLFIKIYFVWAPILSGATQQTKRYLKERNN